VVAVPADAQSVGTATTPLKSNQAVAHEPANAGSCSIVRDGPGGAGAAGLDRVTSRFAAS